MSNPQFINSIAEVVSFRTAKIMAQFLQSENLSHALVLDFGLTAQNPFKDRDTLTVCVKYNIYHNYVPLQCNKIVNIVNS